MTDQVVTKKELELQNAELQETNEALLNQQADLVARIERMESMVNEQQERGVYQGPEPIVLFDPFDVGTNPHHIKKHPEGKVLSWKNPNIRNGTRGWRGWVPITYDSEIGQNLTDYILDPPAKMEGSSSQDNYVRRGTDSILCWLPEELWQARQMKREQKALRKQMAASARRNISYAPGVETFGDGVQIEERPAGGFKMGRPAPLDTKHPSHRTEMFNHDEE